MEVNVPFAIIAIICEMLIMLEILLMKCPKNDYLENSFYQSFNFFGKGDQLLCAERWAEHQYAVGTILSLFVGRC